MKIKEKKEKNVTQNGFSIKNNERVVCVSSFIEKYSFFIPFILSRFGYNCSDCKQIQPIDIQTFFFGLSFPFICSDITGRSRKKKLFFSWFISIMSSVYKSFSGLQFKWINYDFFFISFDMFWDKFFVFAVFWSKKKYFILRVAFFWYFFFFCLLHDNIFFPTVKDLFVSSAENVRLHMRMLTILKRKSINSKD